MAVEQPLLTNTEFEVAQKMKTLVRQHAAEVHFLMKHQLEEEEKLAKQQQATLKENYKKYKLIDSVTGNGPSGSANELARYYGLPDEDSNN